MENNDKPVDKIHPEDLIHDWYLPDDGALDGFVYPNGRSIRKIEAIHPIAQRLLESCRRAAADGRIEFSLQEPHGRLYRGHVIDSVGGKFYQLRRSPTAIPPLEALGLNRGIQDVLLHENLRKGGLILIAGETGNGKSTTSASTLKGRVEKFSSFCLTIEDPPEMPLHGRHKGGRIIQTEVQSGKFADAMRGALRAYPAMSGNILFVGETRDNETASEVLKIATNGHLVITTIHSADVISAIKRFISLATAHKDISEEAIKSVFADAMRVVLHQRLIDVPATASQPAHKKLDVGFLLSSSGSTPVAHMIRKSTIEGLSTPLDNQRRTLEMQGPEGLMKIW
jgi:twitching motility protein PilT